MKSGYQLRSITTRTSSPTGATVTAGPPVSATYPLGYFREDYEFISHPGQDDYLDIHNGRFCVTPEYPAGIYCYFATVDANWNSAYPYVVGPTYDGVYGNRKVTSVTETTTTYSVTTTSIKNQNNQEVFVGIFPNPASDLIAIQMEGLNKENLLVELYDMVGKLIDKTTLNQGASITYFDTKTLYAGTYTVKIIGANGTATKNVIINK